MSSIADMLEAKYGKRHLSYSSIKKALKDIMEFDSYMKGTPYKPSKAMNFGSLYDCLLFTPEDFHDRFAVMDTKAILKECSEKTRSAKNPNLCKEFKDKAGQFIGIQKAKKKTVVTESDLSKAKVMVDRMRESGVLESHLTGEYQREFYTKIETGYGEVEVKGYLDCLSFGHITDLKVTNSIDRFRWTVRDMCWDVQAYIYLTAFQDRGVEDYFWVAQEDDSPHLPAVIRCSEDTLGYGADKFQTAVGKIKEFLESGGSLRGHYREFEV